MLRPAPLHRLALQLLLSAVAGARPQTRSLAAAKEFADAASNTVFDDVALGDTWQQVTRGSGHN